MSRELIDTSRRLADLLLKVPMDMCAEAGGSSAQLLARFLGDLKQDSPALAVDFRNLLLNRLTDRITDRSGKMTVFGQRVRAVSFAYAGGQSAASDLDPTDVIHLLGGTVFNVGTADLDRLAQFSTALEPALLPDSVRCLAFARDDHRAALPVLTRGPGLRTKFDSERLSTVDEVYPRMLGHFYLVTAFDPVVERLLG